MNSYSFTFFCSLNFLNDDASSGSTHAAPDSLHSLQNFAYEKVEFKFALWLVGWE